MAIELACTNCQQMLRVGDEQAGRQARCPKCNTVFQVPTPAGKGESPKSPGKSPTSDEGEKKWFVKGPDGKQYGPVFKQEIDRWASEHRLTADSQLLEEGGSQWRWASDLYPSLTGRENIHTGQFKEPAYAAGSAHAANPYAAPHTSLAASRHLTPHRGGIVLTFGILGLLVCGLFGIAAWVMGSSDLNDMKAGRMDASGHSTTQAGMILGIVSCVMMMFGCCFGLLFAAAG